jgi:hypothetical protein
VGLPCPKMDKSDSLAPPFLRGRLLLLWRREQEVRSLTDAVLGVLVSRFGFDNAPSGAAECAADALVADVTGAGIDVEDDIARLHAGTLDNYHHWVRVVNTPPLAGTHWDAEVEQALVAAATTASARGQCSEPSVETVRLLADLALWYAIRAETVDMRYMPEVSCGGHEVLAAA